IALQRFIGDSPYPIMKSASSHLIKVKNASEQNERIFYICYDISSGNDENAWVESIKFDWVYNIEQTNNLTSSPAYATVNNKPVVQVWGPGFASRVGNSAGTIELIEFLQNRGCYVIGGVPTHWRKEEGDSKPNFMNAYKAYDMVSPWTPGRYNGISEVDNFKNDQLVPDKSFCDANDLDYLPVLFPGFAWSTWKENGGIPNKIPRLAGDFLWRQAYNIKGTGINQMYFAMFDEYDEGTAIMKAATDWTMIPTDYYFLTLSADGTWVSSDYYLRVAGAATAMLKSSETHSGTVSVPHSEGPVYYRNSFEKRFTEWEKDEVKGSGFQNLDPCFYKSFQLNKSNVSNAVCEIEMNEANAKSGQFILKASGNPTSENNASYSYKFSEVKIPVVDHLKLSFWKKTLDDLGQYVSIDLTFKSGKKLSQLSSYVDNNGTGMNPGLGHGTVGGDFEQFICEIGKGELLGDEITGIIVAYDKAASSDSYTSYFDDIEIATNLPLFPTGIADKILKNNKQIFIENKVLNFKNFSFGTDVVIYNIAGRTMKSFRLNTNRVKVDLPNGIFIVSTRSDNTVYSQKIVIHQ
ncbi:MAG: T9SS type A sorting domain-containing protein, partial [Draconibacterium sp.]|nr:T9SS type A sorting domain-containing protein [Draconibacterium sp.]